LLCDTVAGADEAECIEDSVSDDVVLRSTQSNATHPHLSPEATASSTTDAAKKGHST